jgi:hypothetical protein
VSSAISGSGQSRQSIWPDPVHTPAFTGPAA